MIQGTQIIELCYCQKVPSQQHKLVILVSVHMSFPKRPDFKTVLRVHHEVPSQIIEHDGVLGVVELQYNNKSNP